MNNFLKQAQKNINKEIIKSALVEFIEFIGNKNDMTVNEDIEDEIENILEEYEKEILKEIKISIEKNSFQVNIKGIIDNNIPLVFQKSGMEKNIKQLKNGERVYFLDE